MIVTIDGPAYSGKTTSAKLLSKMSGLPYFDPNSFYRAVATYFVKARVFANSDAAVMTAVSRIEDITADFDDDLNQHTYIQINDNPPSEITDDLYASETSRLFPMTISHPTVRKKVIPLMQKYVRDKNMILEGNESGTVIAPEADLKVWLAASPDVRVERCLRILRLDNNTTTPKYAESYLKEKDKRNASLSSSSFEKPSDAITVDTGRSRPESVAKTIYKAFPKPDKEKKKKTSDTKCYGSARFRDLIKKTQTTHTFTTVTNVYKTFLNAADLTQLETTKSYMCGWLEALHAVKYIEQCDFADLMHELDAAYMKQKTQFENARKTKSEEKSCEDNKS